MANRIITLAAVLLIVGALAIPIEALLRARIDDTSLSTPTRFYARPVAFRPGADLDRTKAERSLKGLGYRRVRRSRVGIGEYYLGSGKLVIGRRAFRHYDQLDPGGLVTVRVGYGGRVSDIEDARGRRLRYLALEPKLIGATYGPRSEDRVPVPLSQVPQQLVDAVIAIEDQRFFEHGGIDVRRIAGAAIADIRARRIVQGASTITQQLAKNLFLSSRRSPLRKLREIAMALTLEHRYSKADILEAYLNQIYLGQQGARAIHGVGRAAQFYFGKDVSQLQLSEGALLAGIIRGPSLYAPFRHAEAAKKRRDLVLSLMRERDVISGQEYRRANRAALGLVSKRRTKFTGRYFVDFVKQRMAATYELPEIGAAVFTTLDVDLQWAAERAVRSGLKKLDSRYPRLTKRGAPLQAALVAIDPRTGEVLAMVGGRDYGTTQFNRAVSAHRQPGSSFKPIVALTALASGDNFTLASQLEDKPLSVETRTGLWEPKNYDNVFRGPVTLRDALEHSLNVPFARLGLAVGPERIVRTARSLGIESRLRAVPSLALGSSEVTPLEMTRAFGVVAANGFRSDLQTTLGVMDRAGEIHGRIDLDGEQVYDPATAYLITSALRGVVERGTGKSLRSLGFRGSVAAKSGTTNNFRDAWFIGYTPSLAVGVWVGFDDGKSIGLSGSRAALPIFAQFLVDAVGRYGSEEFSAPPGLEVAEVNRTSGLLAGPGCRGEPELFLRGTAPQTSCSPFWTYERRGRPGRRLSRGRDLVRSLEETGRWGGRRK